MTPLFITQIISTMFVGIMTVIRLYNSYGAPYTFDMYMLYATVISTIYIVTSLLV